MQFNSENKINDTIKKIIKNPEMELEIIKAIDSNKTLGIQTLAEFYSYKPYVESFKNIEYTDIIFYDHIKRIINNDIILLNKIKNDNQFTSKIAKAIEGCRNLRITKEAEYYEYEPYLEVFKNITFLDLSFSRRVEIDGYVKFLKTRNDFEDKKIIQLQRVI